MRGHRRRTDGRHRPPGYWPRELADRLFAAAGIAPKYTCECDEPTARTGDLIGAGLGIGLVPAMARAAEPRTTAVAVRLDHPDCFRTLSLVWREDAYSSLATRALREHAIAFFAA